MLFKYLLVGGAAASLDIGIFSFFSGYCGWPWMPVSIASFILATLLNYFLSIQFVFESGAKYKRAQEILGVFIISTIALAVNQGILFVAIEIFQLNLILSKILATGTVFFWNFLGRKYFVF